jgi:TPR repeat protein
MGIATAVDYAALAPVEMLMEETASSADDLYRLGIAYSTGQGAPVDYVAAHKWFNLAALKGSEDAKVCRSELSASMSPQEIAAALKSAREWLNAKTH